MGPITFTASLPAIQSAVSISGNGDGARIKLDVPGSDIDAVRDLTKMAGKVFIVTVVMIEDD